MEPIKNKVAESNIEVFNLETLWDGKDLAQVDLADFLMEGLVLREKAFRSQVKEADWAAYADRHVAIHCSTDAIVPTWAYMLIASRLTNVAASVAVGTTEDLVRDGFVRALESVDWERYRDVPVVVKGCASQIVPAAAYMIATQKLQQVAAKIMYGEPCSSVPIWRQRKKTADETTSRKAVGVRIPSDRS